MPHRTALTAIRHRIIGVTIPEGILQTLTAQEAASMIDYLDSLK